MRKEAIAFNKNEKGELTEPVPYHGAKEMGKGLANKLIKKYGLWFPYFLKKKG